jgi:hypothetical protein
MSAIVRGLATAAFVAAFCLSGAGKAADAGGVHDGLWTIDVPAAGPTKEAGYTCPALRLRFRIKDGQISGSLARVYGVYGTNVENGDARNASPLTGTVLPDGTLHSSWESIAVIGKVTGDRVEMTWRGECGPRVGAGMRIG